MSTLENARVPDSVAARAAALLGAVVARLRDGLADLSAARRARFTVRTLSGLSDSQLKDIGLSRSDIGRVARAARAED